MRVDLDDQSVCKSGAVLGVRVCVSTDRLARGAVP